MGQVSLTASFGLFYPDAGVIILNPDAFGSNTSHDSNGNMVGTPKLLSANINRGEMANYEGNERCNPELLYHAISSSGNFIVDTEEKVTSQYYFARAKNFEYNYTTNPSFTDGSGNLTFSSMINNPVTYITTVGLYNDSSDLVAVAKLSQPVVKDFTKEALIRVKLDY